MGFAYCQTNRKGLNLNLDLIEAAALGHDLGHAPYGHVGERALNEKLQEKGFGYFCHNANSVRNILYLERNGKGYNVSLQVLDAILCHNGEMLSKNMNQIVKNKRTILTRVS